MSDFIIPLDDAIYNFGKHLSAYPRTILSAKFGDGKSYFIREIKNNLNLQKNYEFITIYPVNYQVVGNRDIFDILKRDILFQLILHDMVSNNVKISEADAFSWFLATKGSSLTINLLTYIAEIGLDKNECSKILAAFKCTKIFVDIKNKIKTFKESYLKTDEEQLDSFLEKMNSHYLYESDIITKIIHKSITDYQRRTKKKIVLFVEDMDRIDPAHLFRILNILSAHMDYGYKDFYSPNGSPLDNKFGIDNIVLVLDFHNLKNIYRHFYGAYTDFNGYISKFLSGQPFYYSLNEQKYEYTIAKLSELTTLDNFLLKKIFTREELTSKTMREIIHSFRVGDNAITQPIVSYEGKSINLNTSFLSIMAIMRRLKCTDKYILERLLDIKDSNFNIFISYILPYLFLFDGDGHTICITEGKTRHKIVLILNPNNGMAEVKDNFYCQDDDIPIDLGKYINKMFEYIS